MATTVRERQFTGWHMLASLVAFFGVIIGVNLTLVYFANSTWSGLVVKNGYVASQTFDDDLARAKAQDAWGWSVGISHTESRLRLTFEDEQQLKIDGLVVTGKLRRPASDRYDETLTFGPAGAGVYSSPMQLLPGVWEVDVDASGKEGHAYRKTFRFVVKG